jgi:hypothetical protein
VNYLSNTSIQVQGFIMRELMNGICCHILMGSKVDVLWWLADGATTANRGVMEGIPTKAKKKNIPQLFLQYFNFNSYIIFPTSARLINIKS